MSEEYTREAVYALRRLIRRHTHLPAGQMNSESIRVCLQGFALWVALSGFLVGSDSQLKSSANLSLVLLILIENKRADHRLIHSTILENR